MVWPIGFDAARTRQSLRQLINFASDQTTSNARAGILPKSREMIKRKLSQRKPRAPHLIHSFSTEQKFSPLELSADDRRANRARFVRRRASRRHRGSARFAASSSLRSRRAKTLVRPRARIFGVVFSKQTRAEKRFDLFAIRSMAFRGRSRRRATHRTVGLRLRSSKPDRGDLRADCRAHFFQLNKRPVRKPATEFSTGREIPTLWKSTARNRLPGFLRRSAVT